VVQVGTRIAVGVDFSPESDLALTHAATVARRHGNHIVVVHVMPVPSDLLGDSSYDPLFRAGAIPTDLAATRREAVTTMLQEAAERCRDLGITCEPLIVDDNPSDGLARGAEAAGADLLVLGSHGRSGVKRWLLGSVAERTARLCRRNTLIARGAIDPQRGYRRIVVGTDFSPHADEAVRAAVAMGGPDATVEVVHCWQTPILPAGMPVGQVRGDLDRNIAEAGERSLASHRHIGARLTFTPIEAGPAEGITTRATETGADLIVVGSHGRRGVKHWLLGSVAETTIRHSTCAVLVARQPGPQGAVG
jgi:nucleotide-binding universal stress UspA family protein